MLEQRIITAIVSIPIITLTVWYGGLPLMLLIAIIIVIGIKEIHEILLKVGVKPSLWLALISGMILTVSSFFYLEGYPGPAIITIVFLNLIFTILLHPRYTLLDGAGTLMAALYVGMLTYLYLLRTLPDGLLWLLYMLAATWICDAMAFFIGKRFGTKKVFPSLSPKKTLEGAIGGVTGSLIITYIFYLIYPIIPLYKMLILGLLVGLAAEAGDLLESAFKRQAGIKDTSSLIPGHGGVLDRFDSALFTAPLVYYYVILFL